MRGRRAYKKKKSTIHLGGITHSILGGNGIFIYREKKGVSSLCLGDSNKVCAVFRGLGKTGYRGLRKVGCVLNVFSYRHAPGLGCVSWFLSPAGV